MAYDGKEHCLDLIDFYVSGSTLLGTSMDGNEKEIEEGMQGSRADIADFSAENNSVKFSKDEKLIELLDKLNTTLSNFNNNTIRKEEEIEVENKENFEEVTETVEVTETEETTEEEVTVTENESEETVDETSEDETVDTEDETTEIKEDNACGGGSGSAKKKKKNSIECSYTVNDETKTYAVSLDEKISAIHCLVNDTYAEADNTYYGVSVYDSYVIMQDWCSGRYFKQSYMDENDTYTLTGDRVEVYAEFVTKDELNELNDMRSNYSTVVNELNQYKYNEEFADKMTVFEDEAYTDYLETDEFKALMSKETVDKYSKEELAEKADATLGKFVKSTKTFSYTENKTKKPIASVKVFSDVNKTRKPSRYGDLFKNE